MRIKTTNTVSKTIGLEESTFPFGNQTLPTNGTGQSFNCTWSGYGELPEPGIDGSCFIILPIFPGCQRSTGITTPCPPPVHRVASPSLALRHKHIRSSYLLTLRLIEPKRQSPCEGLPKRGMFQVSNPKGAFLT
jgi:hypothetical protein